MRPRTASRIALAASGWIVLFVLPNCSRRDRYGEHGAALSGDYGGSIYGGSIYGGSIYGGSGDGGSSDGGTDAPAPTDGGPDAPAPTDGGPDAPAPPDSLSCGDGIVEAPEGCDDGNTIDWDGCSASCQLEDVSWDLCMLDDRPSWCSPRPDDSPDGPPPPPPPPPPQPQPAEAGVVTLYAIPATTPLDWSSPRALGESAAFSTAIGERAKIFPKMHAIGHALTVVSCTTKKNQIRKEVISQTGEPADLARILSERTFLAGALLRKFGGSLQEPDDAMKELAERMKYLQYFKYRIGENKITPHTLSTTHPQIGFVDPNTFEHIPTVVQIDMMIDETQCDAIFEWLDAYKQAGAQTSYGVHFAPWLLEGGGCGSVALTAAFWASGAEWQSAACGWSVPLQIGSARIGFGNEGINGTYPKGSLLQNGLDTWPASEGAVSKFKDLGITWTSDTMKSWTGADDYEFNAVYKKKYVPLRIIDPSKIAYDVKQAWQLAFKNMKPGEKLWLLGAQWEIVQDPTRKHIHIRRSIVGKAPRKVGVDKDPAVCK